MSQHRITSFDAGGIVIRSAKPYQEQILRFLADREAPAGDYHVRILRRVRSALPAGETRLRPLQRNSLSIILRPVGVDNGGVFEVALAGQFAGWHAKSVHAHFQRFEEPQSELETLETEESADTPPPPDPPAPKLTLSEKLARLERIAQRATDRERSIAELQGRIDEHKKSIAGLQAAIQGLEASQLEVMHAAEQDTECQSALEDLKALERLLG